MLDTRTKKIILWVGAVCVLFLLYVVMSNLIVVAKLRKLHLGMTEAEVIGALGEPTYASDYDRYSGDDKSSGRILDYNYCYFWDHPLRVVTEFFHPRYRYYNPRYITVDFRNGSRTATDILYHRAYARRLIVIARKR